MPRNRNTNPEQTNVSVGNLSNISGEVNIAVWDITTDHTVNGSSAADIRQLFDGLYTAIETRANTSIANKEDLKAEVKEIQAAITEAAQKNEKVDEGFLLHRFRNIARVVPNLLDVIVTTLANPLAGLGVAFGRIADRARQGTRAAPRILQKISFPLIKKRTNLR